MMGLYVTLLKQFKNCLTNLELKVLPVLGIHNNNYLDYNLNWNYCPSESSNFNQNNLNQPSILERVLGDGILWAVPNKRRTVERRLTRHNAPEKRRHPKHDLTMCGVCGHYHQMRTICGNCYLKVREETKAIQGAMNAEWKLEPVDKEVIVSYQTDPKTDKEFWNGKRIVEVERERPLWFHQNLQSKCITDGKNEESSLEKSSNIISQIK